ncbi:MAG: hypothetical protein Q8P41_31540 [Pseudomonadota bacterium]|nr:hypothetical protein [Pseudomonadota bacterium]
MNVIVKSPIRISATEQLAVGAVVSADVFGKSLEYLIEREIVATIPEKVGEKLLAKAHQPIEEPPDPQPPVDPHVRKKF